MCVDVSAVTNDDPVRAARSWSDPLSFLEHYTYVREIKAELDAALRPLGLCFRTWVMLRELNDGAANQKTLAKNILANKVAVSRDVKALEKGGMVTRMLSEADRRQSLVLIRARGRQALQDGAALLSKHFSPDRVTSLATCERRTAGGGKFV